MSPPRSGSDLPGRGGLMVQAERLSQRPQAGRAQNPVTAVTSMAVPQPAGPGGAEEQRKDPDSAPLPPATPTSASPVSGPTLGGWTPWGFWELGRVCGVTDRMGSPFVVHEGS